jgi:hypothetical protein
MTCMLGKRGTTGAQSRVTAIRGVRYSAANLLQDKVPEARVELARGCPRRILSPLRLPFRHSGLMQNKRGGGEAGG